MDKRLREIISNAIDDILDGLDREDKDSDGIYVGPVEPEDIETRILRLIIEHYDPERSGKGADDQKRHPRIAVIHQPQRQEIRLQTKAGNR